jgi:transposase
MLIHKRRKNTIKTRVRMTNSTMSSLLEFGYLSDLSKGQFGKKAREEVNQAFAMQYISESVRDALLEDAATIEQLYKTEKEIDSVIVKTNRQNEKAKRLETIIGIGPINASLLSSLPMEEYETPRDFSASLGLVPSQHTTGGEIRLGSITKHGNRYARTMLIQGARSVVVRARLINIVHPFVKPFFRF